MAEPFVIPYDMLCKGTGRFHDINYPAGSITNAAVSASAEIDATKLVHMVNVGTELFGPATTVTALTKLAYVAKGDGTLSVARGFVITPANDVSRTVTVTLQKSTGGGAFATVFSADIGFTNGSTARTLVSGTFSSTSYVAGDIFQWVVAVAGGSGTQAAGLFAEFTAYESTS